MSEKTVKCPVCGNLSFDDDDESYDFCEVCNWCHNEYQEKYPDEDALANIMSLNEAKEAYKNGEAVR